MADRGIRPGVHRIFRLPLRSKARVRADVDEELESFLEARTEHLIARGMDPAAARAEALRRLGGATVGEVREYLYDSALRREERVRFRESLHRLHQDVRFALRSLVRAPGFTLVAVLTLALGIGASTAIFSAVNPILFEPLPYPHPERILRISDVGPGGSRLDVTFGTYHELAERSRAFDALAVVKPWQPTVTGASEPERLDGQRVSAGYFRALGVPPVLGRAFEPSDDRVRGPKVAILSHGLWRRRFGGDASIVGRLVTLDDNSYTVIGVMPSAFENVLEPSAELWAPLQYGESFAPDSREWGHHLRLVGRLRPGVEREQAAGELAAIARTPVPEFPRVPWASLEQGLTVSSLQDDVTYGVKPALLAVFGAVILLLTIACVNVTNLLLARGAQRRGEFAVRSALGAGRPRLIRQLLTESVLLAVLGGVLGMVVAELGVRALVVLSPPGLPRLGAIHLDATVFVFALGIVTLTGLVVGLIPALQASRAGLGVGLQQSSRRTAGTHASTRGTLVVAEVALAVVLLVSAGLLLRSLQRLFSVPVGFDASRLLTMQVQTSGHRFDVDSVRYRFFEQALDAVRRVPGVQAAAFTSQLPLSGDLDVYGVHFERDRDRADALEAALRYAVTPGYFEAMRIPLRRGRLLDAHDVAGAPQVVLINESFAKRRFPGGDPIGERLHFGPDDGRWYTIVGVVGDVKQASLGLVQSDAVYVAPTQWHWVDGRMSLVVRSRGEPAALAPDVRRAVWSVDKDQPIVRVATMPQLVAWAAAERRFALIIFEAFGIAALVLSATGIYGVLSGSVAERKREIGVRSALGASRGTILGLVVRQGMTLTALGVVIGLAGAVAASQALVSLLFGVQRLDPATYLGVIALLVGVSGVACSVPAWRAARVDPSIALRAE
jgi:putative ABC transport system permease protein